MHSSCFRNNLWGYLAWSTSYFCAWVHVHACLHVCQCVSLWGRETEIRGWVYVCGKQARTHAHTHTHTHTHTQTVHRFPCMPPPPPPRHTHTHTQSQEPVWLQKKRIASFLNYVYGIRFQKRKKKKRKDYSTTKLIVYFVFTYFSTQAKIVTCN